METESPSSRRWTAAVFFLGAVFFAALGVGVVTATARMHAGLALLLRLFIGLLFGSLSLGALLAAGRALRPLRPPPEGLLSRCLCCGEHSPAEVVCPRCAQPPHDRAGAIRAQPARWVDAVLVSMGSSAVLCLGGFVAVGPYLDGERRLWVLLAVGALAVLLLLVGAAGAVGSLLDAAQRWRVGAEVTTRWVDGPRWLSGQGTTRGGRLSRFEGDGGARAPLRDGAAAEAGYRRPADTRLAETLATFEAAGLWRYFEETAWRWVVERDGARDDLRTTEEKRVRVEPAEGMARREGELQQAVGAFLWFVAAEGVSLAELLKLLDEEPGRRAQCDAHAEALRDAGVRVLPARVEALHAALTAALGTDRP